MHVTLANELRFPDLCSLNAKNETTESSVQTNSVDFQSVANESESELRRIKKEVWQRNDRPLWATAHTSVELEWFSCRRPYSAELFRSTIANSEYVPTFADNYHSRIQPGCNAIVIRRTESEEPNRQRRKSKYFHHLRLKVCVRACTHASSRLQEGSRHSRMLYCSYSVCPYAESAASM